MIVDEDSKIERKDKEGKEDEELARSLEEIYLSWEERNAKQMDLAERKRRRPKDQENDSKKDVTRIKRMKQMK